MRLFIARLGFWDVLTESVTRLYAWMAQPRGSKSNVSAATLTAWAALAVIALKLLRVS